MPTQPYKLLNGEKVPGTTTIIGRFKDSESLIRWAWAMGLQQKDYIKIRDDAGKAGTIAHDRIECDILDLDWNELFLKKYENTETEILEKADTAFNSYLKWKDENTDIEIMETERAMIHERFAFGGTADALGKVDGKFVLLDWKTSSALRPDNLIQLSAYALLYEESEGIEIEQARIVRFDKNKIKYQEKIFDKEQLKIGKVIFLQYRQLYSDWDELQEVFKNGKV